MPTQILEAPVAHVRFAGRSVDVPLEAMNLQSAADDRLIRERLARYLEVSPRELDPYVIDRHPNGNLTIRPQAVFG